MISNVLYKNECHVGYSGDGSEVCIWSAKRSRFVQNSCDKLKLEQGIEITLFLKDSVFKTMFTGNAWYIGHSHTNVIIVMNV